jgi:hypothetical protein
MNERPPSAAASIYPHLKSQERPVQRPSNTSLATAMYAPKLAPKSKPLRDSYRDYAYVMGLLSMYEPERR